MPDSLFARIHHLERVLDDQIDAAIITELHGVAGVIMPASFMAVHNEIHRLIDLVHATARQN